MTLNANKLGLSLAGTMGVAYVVCALFSAFAPELAVKFLGWMIHLVNLEEAAEVRVTFGGFALGLIPILFYSYLVGRLFGSIYNVLVKQGTESRP